ncbi:MAG: ComEA family DNA-binding protein [Planctomycetaceae bacterium]
MRPAVNPPPSLALAALLACICAGLGLAGWLRGPAPPATLPEGGSLLPDLNAAPETQLLLLPGIGPSRAAAIVRNRALGGPFRSLEDLSRVPGFGPSTIEGLRGRVRAGDREGRPSAREPPGQRRASPAGVGH